MFSPVKLRFESHSATPILLGVGETRPRISWQVQGAGEGFEQTAYEIEVTRDGSTSNFVLESREQLFVPWPAEPLCSRAAATVRVRICDRGEWSAWSDRAQVELGLLDQTDWTAAFITPQNIGELGAPAPILFNKFELPETPIKARLYVSALGVYEGSINGSLIGHDVLAPGWTSYDNRLAFQTFDVTGLLQKGENTIEFLLGNGWFRGKLGWFNTVNNYGHQLAVLAQLEITTESGMQVRIDSNDDWQAYESNVLDNDLYDGQVTDLRISTTSDLARELHPVTKVSRDLSKLVTPDSAPISVIEEVAPQSSFTTQSGSTIIDFGQNLVGRLRMNATGASGATVTLRHAEVLENGELCLRPLRAAKATDEFILSGTERELLTPTLTFHGFRYAEITCVGEVTLTDIVAEVISTQMERTGWFESSNPELNQLHSNVVWSMKGNFVGLPTDCPQRDERLGWTGDIHVFAPTATFLFDSSAFLKSWLKDLAAEQFADGSVPFIIPDILKDGLDPAAAGWGDAASVVPWLHYQRFGDIELLRNSFPSMKAWVDKELSLAGDDLVWVGGFQFGDWLDPSAPPENPGKAKTDADLVATAYMIRSVDVIVQAARVLGMDSEVKHYEDTSRRAKHAFRDLFVTPRGRMMSDAQTAYTVAIAFDLLETEAQVQEAGKRLADLVRGSGFRIGTGFLGTTFITDALTKAGQSKTAFRLLLQQGCPSWLYPVSMGATTIWERWDSMLPDGSINPGEMTSFNHYSLGGVADWLHKSVAGLSTSEPGGRSLLVKPIFDLSLNHASAKLITGYGLASVSWVRNEGQIAVSVEVPAGSEALIDLPGFDSPLSVAYGKHRWVIEDPCEESEIVSSSSIRDLFDHPVLWSKLVEASQNAGIVRNGEVEVAQRLAAYLDRPVTELARSIAPGQTGGNLAATQAAFSTVFTQL